MKGEAVRVLPVLVVILGSVGCATVSETFQASGVQVAAFDLQCAPENLQVRTLSQARQAGGGWGSAVVGVQGCGKQTTCADTKGGKRSVRQSEISAIEPPVPAPEK